MIPFTTLIERDKDESETLNIIRESVNKITPKPVLKETKLDNGKIKVDIQFESIDLLKQFYDDIKKRHIEFKF